MNTKTLIVGDGEVGKSLDKLLSRVYDCYLKGLKDIDCPNVGVMHICFPYDDNFINECKTLRRIYHPDHIVIHSTVKPGTSDKLAKEIEDCNVVYSPIRGRHPNLSGSIKTFIKYIAGDNLREIEQYFYEAGLSVEHFSSRESLEFAKVMCTTRLGLDVIFMKTILEICQKRGYDFKQVYSGWTGSYNCGYTLMGEEKFVRPILDPIPGKIGGHCVMQNCELEDNWITDIIKQAQQAIK